jgi:hypothetical protein
MKKLIQAPLFWVTVIIIGLSVCGALIDLRYKSWLITAIFAAVVAGPLAVAEIIKQRQFGTRSLCFVLTLLCVAGIFVFGRYQNERAQVIVRQIKQEIVTFQTREGRAPNFQELSRSLNQHEPIRHVVMGLRFSYDPTNSKGPCFMVYQFPSSWLRTCVGSETTEILKDNL